MTDSTTTRTLVIERDMPHPPERIWRALTEGALIQEWLMSNDFQPVVGHRFTFRATPVPGWNGVIECEVKVVEPHARLSYSWGSMGMETIVAWMLTPTESGTKPPSMNFSELATRKAPLMAVNGPHTSAVRATLQRQ